MRCLLTVLALISSALAEPPVVAPPATALPKKTIPAISLLPDGSELKGVMLPRYDKNRKLVGVLKSEKMILVSANQIVGKTVAVEFFNADQTPRGRIDLISALFNQEKGLITAKEPVKIKSDRLTADGSGLYYSFADGRGFLSGPVTTLIKNPPKKQP